MRTKKNILNSLFVIALVFSPMLSRGDISAQSGTIQWQEPINLSNSPTSSIYPAIVTDDNGFVHIFWAEDLNGRSVDPAFPEERSNSIFYSFWNGASWSQPIDIFYSPSEPYNFPSASIDQSGRLQLIWRGFNGLFYSSVPVEQAGLVKEWQNAQLIASARGDREQIYADNSGSLHVIYSAWEDANSNNHDGNIYYLHSLDGGESWSIPIRLSNVPINSSMTAAHPSVLVDEQGVMHAVWYQAEPPDFLGISIYYTHSEDGGMTWLEPMEMGRRRGDEKWMTMPEIAYTPSSGLHLIWVCGDSAYRCHRWSKDGGLTWTPTQRIFGDMLSLAGWDTLVTDGDGVLYWILQLRAPSAIYYSHWNGSKWTDLQIVTDGFLHGGHYLRAAAHNGNQMDLVLVDQDRKEIWFVPGTSEAKEINPLPLPQSTTPENKDTTQIPVPLSPTLQSTMVPSNSENQTSTINVNFQDNLVLISIIPILGLIIIVLIFRGRFARR